ncbi:MAG: 4Fe-4S binding protein [Halioglobus sp.]|nr:4Fe-4S binding protein [Halioglobus sp.]
MVEPDRIRVTQDRCLAAVSPLAVCERCLTTCPTAAISGGEQQLIINHDRCLACGQCAAVCPTDAVEVAGFQDTACQAPIFECRRTRTRDRADGAASVPCLGGLSETALLAAALSAEDTITLIDRGWCRRCPAGADNAAPWQTAVDAANQVLAHFTVRRIEVHKRPLPQRHADPPPDFLQAQGAARRALFKRVTASPAATAVAAKEVNKVDAGALQRRKNLIAALADSAQTPLGAEHFPTVKISDACCDSRVCASACPTFALASYNTDATGVDIDAETVTASELLFSAAQCTACGACEQACPSGALSVQAAGAGEFQPVTVLRHRPQRLCNECEASFIPRDGEALCGQCQRDRELAREGFGLRRRL